MESTEFDATKGGTEQLPHSVNSLKFAVSRSVEIAAMSESILRPSKTKLVFQSLPVHMRRRVMSHNCKRLPREFRNAHLEQVKKSGMPPKQKRPSRKYRRRPVNLLEEYKTRQKRITWLETHIWHAKRFHMIERWGHRLALAPCDKAFRACYRATSAHCLLQDISYYTPFQIKGSVDRIKELFATITNCAFGLSVGAKAYTTAKREGEIHMYKANTYPFFYIGKVQFLWELSNENIGTLWLFVHPAYSKEVESELTDMLCTVEKNNTPEVAMKKRKLSSNFSDDIQIKVLPGAFNRFRLTGPNSHAVLVNSLKCVENIEKIKDNEWVKEHLKCSSTLHLEEKRDYWTSIYSIPSPSQLPPRMIVSLIVKDPRLMRPSFRTKAEPNIDSIVDREILAHIRPHISTSPLWNTDIHKTIKTMMFTNSQFIEHTTKMTLVPGEVFEDDPEMQSVPVVLIQRPGSQDSGFKKLGYGSGWDIIVPSGYGIPFWLTFIMFGARSGGLRETENLAFEMGDCYLPPDSEAGHQTQKREELEQREKYFRLPPSKRVNYVKLGINSPFTCPWKILLQDWTDMHVNDFYVLRDWRLLNEMQDCILKRKQLPKVNNSHSCLVPVYLHLSVGDLQKHALICLPEPKDMIRIANLFEEQHDDPNEKLRKIKRKEHLITIKRLRKRIKTQKMKTEVNFTTNKTKQQNGLSEYTKLMRELWLPSNIDTVRNINSRETMGYVTKGAFSFTEAQSCGVGYVSYNALNVLLNSALNQVLVRNTTSRKYRLAKIDIIKSV